MDKKAEFYALTSCAMLSGLLTAAQGWLGLAVALVAAISAALVVRYG